MTKLRWIGSILLTVVAFAQAPVELDSYTNVRFGYTVTYPKKLLVAGGESANGDGQRFKSADGRIELAVWGRNNALDATVAGDCAQQIEWLKKDFPIQVTYKVVRKDWYVFSGTAGQQIIYQKTFLRDGVFKTLRLGYPVKEKDALDPVVAGIVASFKP